jgi:transposase
MSLLWYWETESFIQRRYCREYGEKACGRQSVKQWLERFKRDRLKILHKKGAGRPSVDADTVEMVLEAFQRSPSKSFGAM